MLVHLCAGMWERGCFWSGGRRPPFFFNDVTVIKLCVQGGGRLLLNVGYLCGSLFFNIASW